MGSFCSGWLGCSPRPIALRLLGCGLLAGHPAALGQYLYRQQ